MHSHMPTKITRETRRRRVSSSIQFSFLSPTTGDSEAILVYRKGDVFVRCFLRYLFDLLKSQVPSVEELAAEEQVREHCKGQRLPSFPRI